MLILVLLARKERKVKGYIAVPAYVGSLAEAITSPSKEERRPRKALCLPCT